MSFEKDFKTIKSGFLGIGLIVVLVALALTILSIVLAVNVSGWFFIATVILGGYTLVAAIGVFLQGKILNSGRF